MIYSSDPALLSFTERGKDIQTFKQNHQEQTFQQAYKEWHSTDQGNFISEQRICMYSFSGQKVKFYIVVVLSNCYLRREKTLPSTVGF